DEFLTFLIIVGFLNESDFVCGYAVIFHELAFDFGVHIPFTGLIGAQIGEHELCSFLCVVPVVIFGNVCRTMRSLIVGMVFVPAAYHTHIQRHLAGVIGGDEHLCLFLPLR